MNFTFLEGFMSAAQWDQKNTCNIMQQLVKFKT
jgi:hypothetical protein